MKKVILIIVFIISLVLFSTNDVKITEDAIRFRVIANSNSPTDILMKEKVVSELSGLLFKNGDITKIRNNIINNLSLVEKKIDDLFFNNNYDKSYNVIYGLNEFPRKEYNGLVYEEGMYESLVIEIGEGNGNNYWCFLYPSLCMIDYEDNDEDIVYSSKIIEMLEKIF